MRFLAVVLVLLGVFFTGIATAGAQVDGLSYKEDTVFTITDSGVQVITEAVMSNTSRERRSGNTIYYSYFDTYVLIIPTGAQDVTIASRGSALSSTHEQLDEDFQLHTVRLPSQLRSGQSRSFTVSYLLPHGEIRGDGLFFSNPAFHAFPLWSFSDPGTGSLALRVPVDADMNEFGGVLRRTGLNNGYVEWTPRDFSRPEDLFAYVTVTVDHELQTSTFSVAGQSIELQSWPGDDAWATFATETISAGLPELEALIGLPVPDQDTLQITESVTPYFYGYGGWYNPADTSIEIGNELDQTVMMDELTHAWFNRDLFVDRWISEGLAEEYTWRAMGELGWDLERLPGIPNTGAEAATPLRSWGDSAVASVSDEGFVATEEYGYETSWFVIHELYNLIGREGMQRVLAAVDAHTTAYPGDDIDEVTNKQSDWRRLLDLASLQADDDAAAEIEKLFADYVIEESDVEQLDRRREVRTRYEDLVSQDLDWRVPDDVRSSMELWQFSNAESVLDEAVAVQGRFREVAAAMEVAGLELSNAARDKYEQPNPDFEGALSALDQQMAASRGVERLRATVDRERTAEERWGLGDRSLDSFVRGAEAAFSIDDVGQIAAAQASLDSTLELAASVGAERILWAKVGAGAMGLLVVAGCVVIVRGRQARPDLEPTVEDVVLAA